MFLSNTVTLIKASVGDASDLAQLHIGGWQATYGGMVDPAFLASQTLESRTNDWTMWLADGQTQVLIARRDGVAAGFISFGRLKTPPPGTSHIRPLYAAEIYAIYLLPEFWRQGIGTALMRGAVAALAEQKLTSLCLWVIEQNVRAQAFYAHLGGVKLGKKPAEIGGKKLTEICYGWRDTSVCRTSDRA